MKLIPYAILFQVMTKERFICKQRMMTEGINHQINRNLIQRYVLVFNPFNPEFLMWCRPSLNLDMSNTENKSQSDVKNRLANSVDPDETARNEPSHQHLQSLHRYLR